MVLAFLGVGQVLLCDTKCVGKGRVVWNVSNCPWLYLYCGPGAEGRYPGVVFFPLGGSVS